jgi:predicted branched-subunit amino acid permease
MTTHRRTRGRQSRAVTDRADLLERLKPGIRIGIPLGLAAFVLSFSFGVVARPVMGTAAPIVMSVIVFAGSSQFASLAVLSGGGSALAAVVAGILLNLRFLPMGIALGPSLRGGALKRALTGQAVVDASWAIANRGGGRFDPDMVVGATIPQYIGWVLGTVVGVFGADLVGDPLTLGLDAIFPAFFLGLLAPELRTRDGLRTAIGGALIALALLPFAPAGVPILAACLAALPALRATKRRDDA